MQIEYTSLSVLLMVKQDLAMPDCAARDRDVGAVQPVTSGCILKIAAQSKFCTQTDPPEERRE